MFTTTFIFHSAVASLKNLGIAALLAAALCPQLHAESAASGLEQEAAADTKLQVTFDNLANIQKSIETKLQQVRELREKLKKSEDETEKQELEQKIARIKFDITGLQVSFEHIVLGGVNRSILNEQPEEKFNWQDELEQISRPLLSSLKELTARPRQIDDLHRDIEQLSAQKKVIDKALDSINFFKNQALPSTTVNPVNDLQVDWQQRKEDTERKLEISQLKLDSLMSESDTWQSSTGELLSDFLNGRGLTLFIAIILSLVIWLAFKAILTLYLRWRYQAKRNAGMIQAPLLYYSYRLATVTFILFAILSVFYVRGDILLLTLSLIALTGAALALRQTLPRYAAEIRLLLGVGPVRENERLVLNGIPFKVDSLSVFSELRNPDLDGFVRLPLHLMNEHTSRPARKEKWFPCQPEDYVLLGSGSLARVLRQSIEMVEVAVVDSIMQIRTREFIEQNVRNLTREGYGIACSFGIDYQHQAICLDIVPDKFKTAIIKHFEKAELKEAIKEILVEFSGAGASSLDYRIYIVIDGKAAKAYYRAQRVVQQACVDACNIEGWVIPFTQITVHTALNSKTTGDD